MKLNIGKRLFFVFGACITITLIIIIFNFKGLGTIKKLKDEFSLRSEQEILSQQIRRVGYKLYSVIADSQINRNFEDNKTTWDLYVNEAKETLLKMKEHSDTEEEKKWSEEAKNLCFGAIELFNRNMLPLIISNADINLEREIDGKIDKLLEDFQIPIRNYSESIEKEMEEINLKFDNTLYQIEITSIIIAIIGLIIVIIAALINTNSIVIPLKIVTEGAKRFSIGDIELKGMDTDMINKINNRNDELGDIGRAFSELIKYQNDKVSIAQNIAKGNLDIDVSISSDDDKLGKAFSETIVSLNEILGQVNIATDQVSSGSVQVSQASQSLSQGASEQASSLEEITSSVTEVNSQSRQNTENATQVNQIAKQAMNSANAGNNKMKEVVSAMAEINKSAEGIKKVAKAIDDIAFQINLLALNANVEAARAGKYGKGFAVVAEEVRNLAVRSGQSAKETTQLVEDAINNISNGNFLANETSKQIDDIVGISSKVADIAEEVTTASKEQTTALEQINTALSQIDQVTQANTANAEESASAAEELASQSEQLKSMIARFNLRS